jgi:hypothetical protein
MSLSKLSTKSSDHLLGAYSGEMKLWARCSGGPRSLMSSSTVRNPAWRGRSLSRWRYVAFI